MTASGLSLLTFNIGNPSEERARRQLAWLAGRDEHVLVLTETKASSGCEVRAGMRLCGDAVLSYSSSVSEPGSKLMANGWRVVSACPARISASKTYSPSRSARTVTFPSGSRSTIQ
jgi:exodeoxyribonuclease III